MTKNVPLAIRLTSTKRNKFTYTSTFLFRVVFTVRIGCEYTETKQKVSDRQTVFSRFLSSLKITQGFRNSYVHPYKKKVTLEKLTTAIFTCSLLFLMRHVNLLTSRVIVSY